MRTQLRAEQSNKHSPKRMGSRMERDKRTRLESFSAREGESMGMDELDDYRQPEVRRPARQRSLTLQIALGIWLGGVGLMLTWFLFNLLLATFTVKLIGESFSPKLGSAIPQSLQIDSSKRLPPQLPAATRSVNARQG
ncbi:hypothetical protein NVV93_15620 [Pseudomonas sp. LS44]|uniref:hypothetical protein n=1 Tax=Pseudomonas sp. LS44 TaxID=1357074 RepID=UPI00215B5899|nr:hypothetical protein [Pseudomonas sp. LS44]UVE17005.1 hypothetical protein NVV93_15620 [Pseudomonas sp. LS44]